MLAANVQAGIGVAPLPQDGRCTARGRNFPESAVACLDLNQTYATDNNIGSATSGFSIARQVQSGDLRAGFFGVWQDATSDKARGRFVLQGEVRVSVQASGSIAPGALLYPVAGQTYLSTVATVGTKAVATNLDTITDASAGVIARVLLSGVHGFGGRAS